MKRLLLILTILTCTNSLQSMELEVPQKLSPISLPQIYSYFLTILPAEIARHIFSLQPGSNEINYLIEQTDIKSIIVLTGSLENSYKKNGYCLTVELLKQSLLHANISVCDIKNTGNETALHYATKNIGVARILLEIASDKSFTLLTIQTNESKYTALHYLLLSRYYDKKDMIRLYLDTAGDKAQELIMMPNQDGKTAFDIAMPKEKAIMLPYMQNNQ